LVNDEGHVLTHKVPSTADDPSIGAVDGLLQILERAKIGNDRLDDLLHGGVLQGAGQVFGEHVVYDMESGHLLTGSFVDYFMPRAGLIPAISSDVRPTVSRVSPLGVKGMGESGCTASLPALANAVMDALAVLGIRHLDMPLTSSKIWSAIQSAKRNY
jgi:carbon-monoxide dehydrogenase large subunit